MSWLQYVIWCSANLYAAPIEVLYGLLVAIGLAPSAQRVYCGIAACTMISTKVSGVPRRASTQARAGSC